MHFKSINWNLRMNSLKLKYYWKRLGRSTCSTTKLTQSILENKSNKARKNRMKFLFAISQQEVKSKFMIVKGIIKK